MKITNLLCATLMLGACVLTGANAHGALINVIGGSTGNADFQAATTYSGTTTEFANTPGWVNLGGLETPPSFGANNQLNASTDPVHLPDNSNNQGAFLSVGNAAANTTGWTILTAGEVFDASFFLAGTGGTGGYGDADPAAPGNGNLDDETVDLFLFSSPTAVDDDTALGGITKLATASFALNRSSFTTETATGFYTSTAGDVGSTVYFGIELLNPTGGNPFPRIDVATLDVTTAAVPEPSSFALLGLVGVVGTMRRKRANRS